MHFLWPIYPTRRAGVAACIFITAGWLARNTTNTSQELRSNAIAEKIRTKLEIVTEIK
jgi:hypothetical protein